MPKLCSYSSIVLYKIFPASTNRLHIICKIRSLTKNLRKYLIHLLIMSITAETLKQTITERLSAVLVQVEDMSGGCGQAFAVIIVSPSFQGKNKLMRHRLVNNALKEEIASIHAFTQKGFTPEEWTAQGGQL